MTKRNLLLLCMPLTATFAASCSGGSSVETAETNQNDLAGPAPTDVAAVPAPPPQFAVEACAELAPDAACSFTVDDHPMDGTCRRGPSADDPLACAPAHMPPLPLGPPRAAIDACAAVAADAACTFTIGDQSIDGTCRRGPSADDPLACAPAHMPPVPAGPPRAAIDACAAVAADAACTFTNGDQSIDGTCRVGPSADDPLACAPAHPPLPQGPPREALDACASSAADADCSFTIGGQSIDGTCRVGPSADDPLACVPAHIPPHRPPREALDACASSAPSSACSFEIGYLSIDGTCRRGPATDDPLACAPAHLPPPIFGPPREALDACSALAAGAACGFDLQGRSLTGTCWSPDPRAPLACAPSGLPIR